MELENLKLKQRVTELEEALKEMNEALKESTKLLVKTRPSRPPIIAAATHITQYAHRRFARS